MYASFVLNAQKLRSIGLEGSQGLCNPVPCTHTAVQTFMPSLCTERDFTYMSIQSQGSRCFLKGSHCVLVSVYYCSSTITAQRFTQVKNMQFVPLRTFCPRTNPFHFIIYCKMSLNCNKGSRGEGKRGAYMGQAQIQEMMVTTNENTVPTVSDSQIWPSCVLSYLLCYCEPRTN